jgi:crotonobetainyl-CoA:carnitine CoA-transferase CaiB-like acyl-CoA transferase
VRIHLDSAEQAVSAGLAASSGDGLADELAAKISELTSDQAVAAIRSAGGAAVRARDFREVVGDQSLLAGGHLVELVWPDGNSTFLPHRLAHFTRHRPHAILKATGHGEFSREILAEAGLRTDEIEKLISAGVVVVGEPMHSVVGVGYR